MPDSSNIYLRTQLARPLSYEELDSNFQEMINVIDDWNTFVADDVATIESFIDEYITDYNLYVKVGDIVDNTITTDATKPLSANQGKVLKDMIDAINTLLASDETTLDSLQEVVDYIIANRDTLDSLGIANISGLQSALDEKVSTSSIVNILTSTSTTRPLSAAQGKVLKDLVDTYTAADVLAKLLTVDSNSSGLNANTLQGNTASAFVRTNANTDLSANTEWQDGFYISLGTGSDMRIFHDGTRNRFDLWNGDLVYRLDNTTEIARLARATGVWTAKSNRAASVEFTTQINWNRADCFTRSVTGDATITEIGLPASGTDACIKVKINYTSGNITWPAAWDWKDGFAPDLEPGQNIIIVTCDDGTTPFATYIGVYS